MVKEHQNTVRNESDKVTDSSGDYTISIKSYALRPSSVLHFRGSIHAFTITISHCLHLQPFNIEWISSVQTCTILPHTRKMQKFGPQWKGTGTQNTQLKLINPHCAPHPNRQHYHAVSVCQYELPQSLFLLSFFSLSPGWLRMAKTWSVHDNSLLAGDKLFFVT